jgi:glycosyltransferase involved in cell wall biosynthesis
MQAFGSEYGGMIASLLQPRRRALFVTYRYNSPPRGGGEYYVNRLVSYLADSGVSVDVLTPKVDQIYDADRFASDFPRVSGPYPVPFGNPRVRVAKFDTESVPARAERLDLAWGQQPDFERALFRQFSPSPNVTGLLWGWADGSRDGRWTMNQFAMQSAKAGTWHLKGNVPAGRYLVIRGIDGAHLLDQLVDGHFECVFDAPSGVVKVEVFQVSNERSVDPRPLGLFMTDVRHSSTSLLEAPVLAPWHRDTEPLKLFNALHTAALETRFTVGASLADNRGPCAPELEAYLEAHAADYDLIITHNAVFRTASQAVKAANRAGIPSIVVPHAHFEDDYYHFPDVMACIQNATRALVTPSIACQFLKQIGLSNVDFLSPGIDGQEEFTKEDEAAFHALYGRKEPFVLVAGRKAAIKGYRDVIAAVSKLRDSDWPKLRVVMIGPDDDGQAVTEEFVDYLGMVDRNVLRGAYRACSVLANMSRSESFGIVLLEAGLASRAVVANADCAAFVELVSDGKNGYLANRANLADRLAAVLADRSSAKTMGKNGRKMALEYSWDQIGAEFVHHCIEVMSIGRVTTQ